MKILKYLLFILLALAFLFFLLGVIKPKVEYGHSVTVDKPVAEAWAVQQDASKLGLWLDGFKSIELIEGEQGTIGSRYRVVVNPGQGQPDFEMIETVNSFKVNDHIDLAFDSDMMVFNQRTSFSESNGQTTITTKSEVNGKGMMMRSMFALMSIMGNSFQVQEEKNIEALKKVIEENTTDYTLN